MAGRRMPPALEGVGAPVLQLMPLMPTARRVVEDILGVRPGEQVCVVTDTDRPGAVTAALAGAARHAGAEVIVVTMEPRDYGGMDPPAPVQHAIWASQVAILQTSFATTHTETVRQALRRGVRVCEFWGITEEMMVRGGLAEDPVWLERVTDKVGRLLEQAQEARLTTPDGTDIRVRLAGRPALRLAGTARQPGGFASLPAGEAAVAPLEGTARGRLVRPYLVEHREVGRPQEPLEVVVEDGQAVEVRGGVEAQRLARALEAAGPSGRNLAEFAIGTNRRCRLDVGLREAKKTWGTAHVALGDNGTLGGNVESPLHIDLIFQRPTVTLDGQVVVQDGRLLVDAD